MPLADIYTYISTKTNFSTSTSLGRPKHRIYYVINFSVATTSDLVVSVFTEKLSKQTLCCPRVVPFPSVLVFLPLPYIRFILSSLQPQILSRLFALLHQQTSESTSCCEFVMQLAYPGWYVDNPVLFGAATKIQV